MVQLIQNGDAIERNLNYKAPDKKEEAPRLDGTCIHPILHGLLSGPGRLPSSRPPRMTSLHTAESVLKDTIYKICLPLYKLEAVMLDSQYTRPLVTENNLELDSEIKIGSFVVNVSTISSVVPDGNKNITVSQI